MKRVARTSTLVEDHQTLRNDTVLLFARQMAMRRQTEAKVRRAQKRAAETTSRLERHGQRRAQRLLRLLIGARICSGCLPNTLPASIHGSPGSPGNSGVCEACDGYMPSTLRMMAIPDGDWFVYVHAYCYVIWEEECRLHMLVRRFEPFSVTKSYVVLKI